jgi:hypothetical protein
MSKAVKIKIHKTMVQPVVVFGSETQAMAEMDMTRLGTRQDNIKRDIQTSG